MAIFLTIFHKRLTAYSMCIHVACVYCKLTQKYNLMDAETKKGSPFNEIFQENRYTFTPHIPNKE